MSFEEVLCRQRLEPESSLTKSPKVGAIARRRSYHEVAAVGVDKQDRLYVSAAARIPLLFSTATKFSPLLGRGLFKRARRDYGISE